MAEFKQLEFFLLGYVPNTLRQRGIEVAVCLRESDDEEGKFAGVRFINKWERVQEEVDPMADLEILQAWERDIRSHWLSFEGRQVMIRHMEDSLSNTIRVLTRRACLSQNPVETLNELDRDYLKAVQIEGEAKLPARSGVGYIRKQMRNAFEQQGILGNMLIDIAPVEQKPGDRLRFAFGYPSGADLRLLQAVTMHSRLDMAEALAGRYPKIASDFANEKGVKTWLTAVVEDDAEHRGDEAKFALDMLKESGIQIVLLKDMPRIANEIRQELRV